MFPMLHTKPQAIDPSVPKNKIFKGFFLPYMANVPILIMWPICGE